MMGLSTQQIRALDVLAIGPAMIWGGYHGARTNRALGFVLALSGLMTIAVNGDNLLRRTPDEDVRGRAVDLVVGPLMVWGAWQSRDVSVTAATFLALSGVSAVGTNTDNLFKYELR